MNNLPQRLNATFRRLAEFLKDSDAPLWQRALPLGVALLLMLALAYSCGDTTSRVPTRTPEDVMGDLGAGSGLGEISPLERELLSKADKSALGPDTTEGSAKEVVAVEDDATLEERERLAELEDLEDQNTVVSRSSEDTALIAARAKAPFASFTAVADNPLQVLEGPDGSIWVVDKTAVLRFAADKNFAPETILNQELYDREFNEEMPKISSFTIREDGSVWVGFFNGQVARYHRFAWRILTRAGSPVRGRVFDVKALGPHTFFAGRGIWRWDEGYQRAISAEQVTSRRFNALLISRTGTLFAAGSAGLWVYNPEDFSWRRIWAIRREDRGAYCLTERKNGSLLICTSNGVVEVSPTGVVTDRLLNGQVISSILDDGAGNLFIGTKQHGLYLWDGQSWSKAGVAQGLADRIDSLYLDSKKRLWVAASRDGLFVTKLDVARTWLQTFREASTLQASAEPQFFADACEASSKVLEGITLSKDIAVETNDGVSRIFFKGKQICPKGSGYRRADGLVALRDGWTLTIYRDQAREILEIPKELAVDQSTALYLDSKDRIWIGTNEHGLYRYSNGNWQTFGKAKKLLHNSVSSILEDRQGRIWIGSSPVLNRETRKFAGAPLRVIEGDTWTSLSPRSGFGSWAVHDLHLLENGNIFAGTSNGFSIIDSKGPVQNYSKNDGLDPHYSFAAAIDLQGNPWMAHSFYGNGITWFDGKRFFYLGSNQGLYAERIVELAHDRSNRVWLIDTRGQVAVYPLETLQKLARIVALPSRRQTALK